MNGDSTYSASGYYGTQGVFDSFNTPPGLYEACEWTDKDGNFWLFGGYSINGALSDMWEFKPLINQWCWIKGTGNVNQAGIYGIQGIPSPTNNPGGRSYTVLTWVDTIGNLWLFGGLGFDKNGQQNLLNDLWKYDINTNEWAWINGSDSNNIQGNFGTKGFPSITNFPGSRCETSCSWTDNSNNLWLFGGNGFAIGNNVGGLNDLWKYEISTNIWTWMNGSETLNAPSNYGIKGVSSPNNTPGCRYCHAKWKDCNGNFWMFGGTNAGDEMWKYDISSYQWIWISGDTIQADTISLGQKCITLNPNHPCARCENRACWKRRCNNLEFFGGLGFEFDGPYSDLWDYNIITNEWTLINGSILKNQIYPYNTPTMPSPTNYPNNRAGALGWIDNYGNYWLFGGMGISFYNDLVKYNDMWRFVPNPCCPYIPIPVSASFTADTLQGCAPLTVNFTNTSINGTSYLWNFGDGSTATAMNPAHTYTDTGTFTVTLTAINDTSQCGRYSNTNSLNITIGKQVNVTSSFTANTDYGCAPLVVAFSNTSSNATAYYWSLGNGQVDTAMNPQHIIYPDSGTFQVTLVAFNENPVCPNPPDIRTLDITVGECELYFPNVITPNADMVNDLFEYIAKGYSNCNLTIFNRWGEEVYTSPLTDSFWDGKINFTSTEVVDGTYYYIFTATDFYGKPFSQKGSVLVIR
jgi:gliding motility-associated-like protein